MIRMVMMSPRRMKRMVKNPMMMGLVRKKRKVRRMKGNQRRE